MNRRNTIAVLDFPGFRADPMLSELRLEDDGYRVRYLLTEDAPLAPDAGGYAAVLRDRLGVDAEDLAGVVAYCLSAPIAARLVERIGRPGLPLVLLNAGVAGDEDVREVLEVASARLGMGAADLPVELFPPYDATRDLPERLTTGLRDVAEQGLAGLMEPDEAAPAAAEMASLYLAWILHVIAAADAGKPAVDGPALHLMTRDHVLPEVWRSAPGAELSRLDADGAALVTGPEARSTLLGFLAGQPAS